MAVAQNGYQKWKERSESSKMTKIEAPGIKELIIIVIGVWVFKKITKICMEKGYWWATLAHQQYLPYKAFKFPQNSNCHIYSFFNVRSLKLGHCHIFDMPFLFLVSVLYHDHFLWLARSRDPVMLEPIDPLVFFFLSKPLFYSATTITGITKTK